jgi:predicted aspartyl protease
VPFELVRSLIILTATLGDASDLHFLIDTGGDPSAVDLSAARRLGLPLDTTVSGEASGVGGGRVKIYPAKITRLRIGTLDIPEIEALAVDLSSVSRRLGLEVAGILGFSFLQDRIVEIDFPGRRLRLLSDARAYARDAIRVPLKTTEDDRTPLLERVVYVNGRSLPVSLDTGSNLTLEVFPNARRVLGPALWEAEAKAGSVLGARGEAAVRHVEVDSIAIGQWKLETRAVTLSDRSPDNATRMGNLGSGSLLSFVLTLDY